MLVEVTADSEQPWAVLFANEAWEQAVKRSRPRDGHRAPFWDIFQVQQPCSSLQHRPRNSMSDGREVAGWTSVLCTVSRAPLATCIVSAWTTPMVQAPQP
jgi:hypothetical protein